MVSLQILVFSSFLSSSFILHSSQFYEVQNIYRRVTYVAIRCQMICDICILVASEDSEEVK